MAKGNRSKHSSTRFIGSFLVLILVSSGVLLIAVLSPDATSEPERGSFPTPMELPSLEPTLLPTQTETPAPPTPIPTETVSSLHFIVAGSARTCPDVNCTAVINFFQGSEIYPLRIVEGESFADSTEWWVVQYGGQELYIHSSYLTREPRKNNSFQLLNQGNSGVQQVPQQSQPAAAAIPQNCDDAVAMGLNARQTAQYSHLDADKDGVACYGD